jgi:hypothetical protein
MPDLQPPRTPRCRVGQGHLNAGLGAVSELNVDVDGTAGDQVGREYRPRCTGSSVAGEGEVSVGNAGWLVGDGRQAGSVALG